MNKKTTAIIGGISAVAVALYAALTITGTGQSVSITEDSILVGNFSTITILNSGTADDPMEVNGEAASAKCIKVSGNYVNLHGFEVSGCNSHGIFISGDFNTIENNSVHGTVRENGTFPSCGGGGKFGSAIKIYYGAEHNTLRGNEVYENCGEGIAVTRGKWTVVQSNTVWDNYSVNIYVDNSPYTDVLQNTVKCVRMTKSSGITLGEEYYASWGAQRHDINVVDNDVAGCDVGILSWISRVGGTAKNIYIAANYIPTGVRRSISIQSVNENVIVENNAVFNTIYIANLAGVTARNNTIIQTPVTPTRTQPPPMTAPPSKTPTVSPTYPTITPSYTVTFTSTPTATPTNTPRPPTATQAASTTIAGMIAAAQSGDVIRVPAGTYPEYITLSKTGLTIIADGEVIMRGWMVSGNNNTIRGFTITNPASNYGIMVTGAFNVFEGNEIYHTKQDGIWFFGHDNTFRGNYVHDILDPSISGDPHVDCYQTWGSQWETYNILFDGNFCDHTRTSGSNQMVMLENQSAYPLRNITFQNNVFIMHDAGDSLMNFHRKSGQLEIADIFVIGNKFYNVTGAGVEAVKFSGITGGMIANNLSVGFNRLATLTNGSIADVFGNFEYK